MSQAQPPVPPPPQFGRLTTGSITGHLIAQTAPAIIAVAAMTSVGIVDAYFIGQLGGAQLAAMSFVFPIAQALASLGVGVLASIASVASRRLGAGEIEQANRIGNLGIVLATGLGIIMALALFAFRHALFRAMNAPPELLPLIDRFIVPYSFGFPLLLVLMGLNGNLRAQGEAKKSSAIMIAMAAANLALNPLLIDGFGIVPGYGIAGSAYASILSMLLATVLGFRALQQTDLPFHPTILKQCQWGAGTRSLAKIAGPASFANAINPMGLSVLTAFLAAEGAAAVAGYGAASRLQAFAIVPLLGLSGSIGAIVGQNWGRGFHDRARAALVQSGIFCLGYGLVVAAIMVLAREPLAYIFTDDPTIAASFANYLSICAWGYAGFGVLIVTNGALNAIDRAGTALLLSAARVVLVMLPAAAILQPLWGAEGVFGGELAANLGGGLLAVLLVLVLFRERPRVEPA
jgi:putative MATE family efflux protein